MGLNELREQIMLALVDAIKASAAEGTLRIRAYPCLGSVEIKGIPTEAISLAKALEA